MALLDNQPNWRELFTIKFTKTAINGKQVDIFDNPDIVYAHSDFDEYLLTQTDKDLMKSWIQDLDLGYLSIDPVVCYKECSKVKKNPYKTTTDNILKYFNRCSWLSLQRKGEVLIESFYIQFYPKITKVIKTQRHVNLKSDNSDDSIVGVIDMIVNLKDYGDAPIILDLKTSSYPYKVEDLEISNQLTLYAALMQNEVPLPAHVGYVVLCKNIPKEVVSICSSCGNIKSGRHKTCEALVAGVRCGGVWTESRKPKPEVQVMIEQKNQIQVNSLLEDFSNVVIMAKNDLTFKNTDYCNNFYGQKCVYYDLCHKGTQEGLKKKGE